MLPAAAKRRTNKPRNDTQKRTSPHPTSAKQQQNTGTGSLHSHKLQQSHKWLDGSLDPEEKRISQEITEEKKYPEKIYS